MNKFILGQRIKDKVSGLTGICTARLEYINGCIQYGIAGSVQLDGKISDTNYIDQQNLVLVDDGILEKAAEPQKPKGGPSSNRPM